LREEQGRPVTETDRLFGGSMPEFYDRYLAPALFEPFARLVAGWQSSGHDGYSNLPPALGC